MSSLRLFFVGGLLSFRALFGWLSPWILIPTYVIAPIFQILLFVFIGRAARTQSDEFYVIGNALQYAAIPCIFAMTNTIAGERYQNTLSAVLATPAKRIPLFVGRSLPVIVNGFFVAVFAFAVGGAIVGIHVPAEAVPGIAFVILVSAFACTGLGLTTAAVGLLARDTATLSNIVFGILLVFTGANVALDDLPGWMSTLAQGLPLTHGIEAARRLADGASFGSIGGLVAAEAFVGFAWGLVGYAMIRTLEWQSRIHATLERA
jgi:ABC-2 type transport system permease protein